MMQLLLLILVCLPRAKSLDATTSLRSYPNSTSVLCSKHELGSCREKDQQVKLGPDKVQEEVEEWEYEPRIWSYDDPKSLADETAIWNQQTEIPYDWTSTDGNVKVDEHKLYPPANLFEDTDYDEDDDGDTGSDQPARDPHEGHYYVGSVRSNYLLAGSGKRIEEGARECNQFRVDIREAIICDKKRCDKLDFEWPKYDNQISHIQTTRDGMRFKRIDLAMAGTKVIKNRQARQLQATFSTRPPMSSAPQRVKIDILDFLKPKPTTSSTTTSPPPVKTSTTSQPTSTSSNANSTTTTTTTTTTPKPNQNQTRDSDDDIPKLITTLRLDTRRLKQKMIGFGGALSDSTCRNIKSLSPQMADSLLEDYFGPRGLRYNIARLSVGSSDFSTTPYTNNDRDGDVSPEMIRRLMNRQLFASNYTGNRMADALPMADDDLEMKNFKLVSEDYDYKLPIVRQAIATSTSRQLLLFASMWSPPIWMKNNSHIVHGYLKGDVYGAYYRSLADLMVRWLEAYRQQGIEFWGFTGLNEPVTGIQPFIFHNSLGITKRDYFTFLKLYLGPMLRQRKFEQLKLLLLDDNKGFVPNYIKSAMSDPQLAQMISGIAYHWYMNDQYENLDFIARDYPQKFVLSTEASNGYLPFQVHTLPGDWDRGVAYMLDIIAGCQHSSSGWVDWNMVLNLNGGPSWAKNNLDAAIIVNGQRDEYYKSPMFYALGHFSRFVEPGSHRLDQILSYGRFNLPLEAVSFLTPTNYIVIVTANENKASIPIRIIVNRRLIKQINLRAQSFNTIVFKAPPIPASKSTV